MALACGPVGIHFVQSDICHHLLLTAVFSTKLLTPFTVTRERLHASNHIHSVNDVITNSVQITQLLIK